MTRSKGCRVIGASKLIAHHHLIIQVTWMGIRQFLQDAERRFLVTLKFIDLHLRQDNPLAFTLDLFNPIDSREHLVIIFLLLIQAQEDLKDILTVSVTSIQIN